MFQFKMKGSIKNKLASLLFFLISLGIVFFIFQNVNKTRQVILVPVLNKPVVYGQLITSEDLKMIEVGIFNMSDKILRNETEVASKFAAGNLLPDRYLYKEDILAVKPATTIKEVIKSGAVAVETDLVKCVGGLPEAGDYVKVDIIYKGTDGSTAWVDSPIELKKVKILAIKNPSGDYVENAESKKDGTAFSGSKDLKPGLILFDVTAAQELKLLSGAYSGILHLILLPPDQQDKKEKVPPVAPEVPAVPEATGNSPISAADALLNPPEQPGAGTPVEATP